ncbi:DEAD/DEAH box helicase [bacterium]|nr:DEAD/DEAH box helicase [bacterium]MBU1064173.1 DEAD/DEAH box helicase [bacterium]MBU1633385.1 DEAD/DEAH box helicase [bacterium]MBU1874820.1 DEAD/DEAH box helicase [bacterium]
MKELLKELKLTRFIAFDLETTGLNPISDAVIEFSAILFENGKKTDVLSFLCNPGIKISPEIEDLTGIRSDMLTDCAPFEDRLTEVLDFLGDLPLVAHNISFDIGFLKQYCRRHPDYKRFRLNNPLYDTVLLSQAFYFYLHNHRLSTVSEYCGLCSDGAHRAEADAFNTGNIFLKLIPEVVKYDLDTLQIINIALKDTNDPNKWLFQNAAKRLLLTRSIGKSGAPAIDWTAPVNIYGKNIENISDHSHKHAENDIDTFFGSEGVLSGILENYESRSQQVEMAQYVIDALSSGKSSVIEAGTGVGKTLAYLIPSIVWQKSNSPNHSRLVIASNTKTLQEQIFFKEIPFVNDDLNLKFKAVMLKGRSNYICLTRWNRFLADIGNKLHLANRSSIIPIIIWLKHTKTGDIAENNGFRISHNPYIWNEICSEPGYCTSSVCQKYDGCYLGKARFHASTADVVVVNHSLLLSDAASNNTVLPHYDALIIDEAHNLEKNSYNYFSSKINLLMLTSRLNILYNSKPIERGLLIDSLQLMNQYKKLGKVESDIVRIKEHINDLKIAAEIFFKAVYQYSVEKLYQNRGYSLKQRYKLFKEEFPAIKTEPQTFIYEFSNTITALQKLILKIDDLVSDLPEGFDDLRIRLTNIITELEEYQSTLKIVETGDDDELIFWYEVRTNGNENGVEFAYTPLDMSETLFEKLLKETRTTILTSATMQIANSFDYIIERTGISKLGVKKFHSVAVGSPFDYPRQMKFITYHRHTHDSEINSIATLLVNLASHFNKGILILFTSYSTLSAVHKSVRSEFQKNGITLLAQGIGGSRTALLDQFRKEKASVLLGTSSFWEGIDVVGDSLEILIITKLPFPVPSEPIIEANVEKLRLAGANPFNDYYVPESVLKFRQGIGRLIRSKTDKGVVINLDDRIDKKAYGRFFKASIPVEAVTITDLKTLNEEIEIFFNTK